MPTFLSSARSQVAKKAKTPTTSMQKKLTSSYRKGATPLLAHEAMGIGTFLECVSGVALGRMRSWLTLVNSGWGGGGH